MPEALATTGSCARPSSWAKARGATTYPIRQPVMAYVLENVNTLTTRSVPAAAAAVLVCTPS